MRNCRECNKNDICGGKYHGVFPCPDFVTKKTKINHSRKTVNRCDVCNKEIKVRAELCSACRKPYVDTKDKFPDATPHELLKLTRELIAEQKKRVIEKRNNQRRYL